MTDFIEQSLYYCFEYRLPFDQFVFDEKDTLDSNAKLEYLLIKLFYRVYEHLTMPEKYIFDNDNPIIRLNDFDRMDVRYFIGKEEITEEMLGLGA